MRSSSLLCRAVVALFLLGAPASAGKSPTETLIFVGTTDVHGHIEPIKQRLVPDQGKPAEVELGGAVLLGGYLANLRARYPDHVVLVDSGDVMQGTPVSNLSEGAVMMRVMNALGYAAAAVGNHEFDYGPVGPAVIPRGPADDPRGALNARMGEARFPWLAANIVGVQGESMPGTKPLVLREVAGIRVALVGGTSKDTPHTTVGANLVGLQVLPLAQPILDAAAAARRAGATVVVAMVHAGGDCKRFDKQDDLSSCADDTEVFELARALAAADEAHRVDALFGGHTHQRVAHRVAGMPVLQAGSYGQAFSRLDLTVDRRTGRVVPGGARIYAPTDLCGAVLDKSGSCREGQVPGSGGRVVAAQYEGREVKQDDTIRALIAAPLAEVAALQARAVGIRLAEPLLRSYRDESELGNLVADVIRQATDAQVGLMNGGGLRTDLPAGELRYGTLFEALPFDNQITRVRLAGATLRKILVRNIGGRSGILSVSGLRVSARCQGTELHVEIVDDKGQPIEDDKTYLVGTIDFLTRGGDDFRAIEPLPDQVPANERGDSLLLRDVVARALGRLGGTLDAARRQPYQVGRLSLPQPRPIRCGR